MSTFYNSSKLLLRCIATTCNHLCGGGARGRRYSMRTAISGHDSHTNWCKTQLRPRNRFGDDACFVAQNDEFHVIGVADGVGGWRHFGVDPSEFSAALMAQCARIVSTTTSVTSGSSSASVASPSSSFSPPFPLSLISVSLETLCSQKRAMQGGSATFCLLALSKPNGLLLGAHLGDAGFLVIRRNAVLHRSAPLKHAFNTPYQVTLLPSPNQNPDLFHRDDVNSANQSSLCVQPGDLIVLATDGLFDNLSEAEILEEVTTNIRNSITLSHLGVSSSPPNSSSDSSSATSCASMQALQTCADKLVKRANHIAQNAQSLAMTPFASEARRSGLHQFKGGNPGDITVLLSLVSVSSAPDPSSSSSDLLSASATSNAASANSHHDRNPSSLSSR